jgi:hypothetical protein
MYEKYSEIYELVISNITMTRIAEPTTRLGCNFRDLTASTTVGTEKMRPSGAQILAPHREAARQMKNQSIFRIFVSIACIMSSTFLSWFLRYLGVARPDAFRSVTVPSDTPTLFINVIVNFAAGSTDSAPGRIK